MPAAFRVKAIERIVVDVPFTPRCQQWNVREIGQWRIVEVIRVTTDVPDLVGYGETILHYTWSRVPEAAVERVKGGNPADFLGDDSLGAGLQMALYDLVGKTLGVPVYRLFNLPRVREWCPISWWNIDMPPEAYAAEAKEAVEPGHRSCREASPVSELRQPPPLAAGMLRPRSGRSGNAGTGPGHPTDRTR